MSDTDTTATGLRLLEGALPALEQRRQVLARFAVGGEQAASPQSLASFCSSSATRSSARATSSSTSSSCRRLRLRRPPCPLGFSPSAGAAAPKRAQPQLPRPARARSRPSRRGTTTIASLLDGEQPVRDGVEQRAVVRDEQHRPGKRLERDLERLARFEVEVVRRLVEHEEVRARGDDDREREPAPLAAREHRDRLLVLVPAGEEEAAEQVLRVRAASGRCRTSPRRAPSRARRARPRAARSTRPRRRDRGAPSRLPARGRPSIVSSSVVFPEPFGPTSATCSPRSIANDASSSSCLSPARSDRALGDDHVASRPWRLQELEAERTRVRSSGACTRSALIRSICLSFDCACFAFDAL